jgi:hypothetical protein
METAHAAKRILIYREKRNTKNWVEAFEKPEYTIGVALQRLKKKALIPENSTESDVTLILTRINRHGSRVVFDIFHKSFDPASAHLYGQDLPVLIVSKKAFEANTQQTRKVNFEIRALFNRYGHGSLPPFQEDGREGPAWSIPFRNFRDIKAYRSQRDDEIKAKRIREARFVES